MSKLFTAFMTILAGLPTPKLSAKEMDAKRKNEEAKRIRLRTQSLEGHQPGRVIKLSDGTTYQVSPTGAYKVVKVSFHDTNWAYRNHLSKGSRRRLAKAGC